MNDNNRFGKLYTAALKADEKFQDAVIKQFGRRRAGTMRYSTKDHNDETRAAAAEYQKAAKAMLDAQAEGRRCVA